MTEDNLKKLKDGFKQKNIRLQLNMDSSPLIYADEMSMEILFGNLISNAYRYTPENGNVEISLSSTTLIITNSAINNQPLEKNKLFQRFQKQQQSSQNSIGVGLEICKHICFQNNFNIQYYFSEGRHSFEVTFQDCNWFISLPEKSCVYSDFVQNLTWFLLRQNQ